MAATGRPTIFSIPVQRAFADALVAGLIDRYAAGALGLAEGLILLPSNRARSALQAAFVRAGGAGLLKPRLGSEQRRGGYEVGGTWRSRLSTCHLTTKTYHLIE